MSDCQTGWGWEWIMNMWKLCKILYQIFDADISKISIFPPWIRYDTIYCYRIDISIFSTKKYVAQLSHMYDLEMHRIPVFETRREPASTGFLKAYAAVTEQFDPCFRCIIYTSVRDTCANRWYCHITVLIKNIYSNSITVGLPYNVFIHWNCTVFLASRCLQNQATWRKKKLTLHDLELQWSSCHHSPPPSSFASTNIG